MGRRERPRRRAPAAVSIALLAVSALAAPGPPAPERPRVYAILHGTVVPSPGAKIEDGTVVLRDGRIEAVGRALPAPPDAEVVNAKGMWVYPALIDATSRFSPAPEPERAARPGGPPGDHDDHAEFAADGPPLGSATEAGAVHAVSRIRAERRVVETLRPFVLDRKREAESHRALGFGAVVAIPQKGILRGTSALVLLDEERPLSEIVLVPDVAHHAAFESGSFGEGYPTSLMGAVAALRQAFLDARRLDAALRLWEEDPRRIPRPERVESLEALAPAIARKTPVVFHGEDEEDAFLAHRIAEEAGIDAIVAGTGLEGEVADRLARTKRPVLLPARFPDRPKVESAEEALDVSLREMRRYLDAPEAALRLRRAGVPFALTTEGLKNPAELPGNLRKIIEAGLAEDDALAALTTVPARLFGVDRLLGTLEPGKIANVLLADGPLFAEGTRVRRLFVDGNDRPIEEKRRPKGDPDAVVDPRGAWSVVFEIGGRSIARTWTIEGEPGRYRGTAETRTGTIAFDRVTLEGNALTVVFPPAEGRGSSEAVVIVSEETFEGVIELGPRSVPLRGTRTSGPRKETAP